MSALPDDLARFGEPEPLPGRSLALSVALGVVVTLAAGMLQTMLCRGNPACMAIPIALLVGGGTAGYVAGRRGGLAGGLVGMALIILTIGALLLSAPAYQRATGRPLPLPWGTTEALLRFAAGGALTILFTALGGFLGLRLRRYVEHPS